MALPFEPTSVVVKVGDGRGFIVGGAHGRRLVVTAAHCLPRFPPCHSASYIQDRTYADLIGQLGDPAPMVWAECLFVDPVADIAVLGSPDNQALFEQAEAYDALMERAALALPIAEPADVDDGANGWLLTLDGRWAKCVVHAHPLALWIEKCVEGIRGGMSGSPILDGSGSAIGVVTVSGGSPDDLEAHTGGGPSPRLTSCLPGWLLRELEASSVES
jgi:Trypsin-like peptidase domain